MTRESRAGDDGADRGRGASMTPSSSAASGRYDARQTSVRAWTQSTCSHATQKAESQCGHHANGSCIPATKKGAVAASSAQSASRVLARSGALAKPSFSRWSSIAHLKLWPSNQAPPYKPPSTECSRGQDRMSKTRHRTMESHPKSKPYREYVHILYACGAFASCCWIRWKSRASKRAWLRMNRGQA